MKAVIFDLDGTLIDSAPDLHAAALAMLAEAGLPPVTDAQTRSFIGNGAPKLVERLLRATGGDPDEQTAMLARFLYHYEQEPVARTTLYPGVITALEALAAQGHAMAICTNKPEAPARTVSDHFGISRFMGAIIGGDSLSVKKPDPAPLRAAITAIGATRILYVGDSETDSATAVAADLPFALYSKGYRKSEPAQIPHDRLFDHFDRLPEIAASLIAA